MHLIGWLSSLLSCIFSGALKWSVIWAIFFCLGTPVNLRGRALGVHQGGVTLVTALWCWMWVRGSRGNSGIYCALCQFSVTSPATHNQIGPFWCWFPGGWVCVCSRTLWGLSSELSCEAGSFSCCLLNPHRCFQSEVWAFISLLELWVHQQPCRKASPPGGCLSPPLQWVWMNVSSLSP